jgi:hypothetical protein
MKKHDEVNGVAKAAIEGTAHQLSQVASSCFSLSLPFSARKNFQKVRIPTFSVKTRVRTCPDMWRHAIDPFCGNGAFLQSTIFLASDEKSRCRRLQQWKETEKRRFRISGFSGSCRCTASRRSGSWKESNQPVTPKKQRFPLQLVLPTHFFSLTLKDMGCPLTVFLPLP